MIRRTHALLFAVALATITIYVVHRMAGPAAQQPMGRYSGQRAIDLATPICRAMLPHRDDLYASVEETWGTMPGDSAHIYWDVAFSDRQGNKLVHVIGDAESGGLRRVSRVRQHAAIPHAAVADRDTPPLSAQQAVACARIWTHTLGFAENWQLAANPRRDALRWQVRLRANGLTVCLDLDLLHGTLLFADIASVR